MYKENMTAGWALALGLLASGSAQAAACTSYTAGATWSFTPDADVVSRALPVLGPHLFHQFALSFMSGNTFAAYDFTAKEFGVPVNSNTIFDFSGTWDMSHVDLYVRDPNGPANHVPEPVSLALAGIGLGWARRRRAR